MERSTVRLGFWNPPTATCIHGTEGSDLSVSALPVHTLTIGGRFETVLSRLMPNDPLKEQVLEELSVIASVVREASILP